MVLVKEKVQMLQDNQKKRLKEKKYHEVTNFNST